MPRKSEPTSDSQLTIVAVEDPKPLTVEEPKPLSQSHKIRDDINDDAPGSKRRYVSCLSMEI